MELRRELKSVIRSWGHDKLVGGFVVLTVALGVGANAAMFGVVDRLLLHGPEGIQSEDRVIRLYRSEAAPDGKSFASSALDYPAFVAMRHGVTGFEDVGAYTLTTGTLGRGPGARHLEIEYASASLFSTLGAAAFRGRTLGEADDADSADLPGAVIATGFGRRCLTGQIQHSGNALSSTMPRSESSALQVAVLQVRN